MGRLLAIDYGSKRVGIAVSDPLQIIASPLETVHSKDIISFLTQYNIKEGIDAFVVGMPKRLDNTDTHSTQQVIAFVKHLQRTFPDKPVHCIDERFTSSMATRALIDGGMKKKDRQVKGNVDKVSAAIILQSYMDQRGSLNETSKA
jgi:putative holliday junction resolvase